MLFPISGVTCDPFVPPLVSFVVSFAMSMGGMSGAFLLLPYPISILGYTHPSVSATNQFYNVVATPGGAWRYIRDGRMLWPLAWLVVLGTLPGVFAGALLRVTLLPDVKDFKVFAGALLLYMGIRVWRDMRHGAEAHRHDPATTHTGIHGVPHSPHPPEALRVLERHGLRIRYTFGGEEYGFTVPQVLGLTFVVGIVGGAYGIGGGAFIAPFLVAVLGLPVYTVAGACLLATFITSLGGVAIYSALAPFFPQFSVAPDWMLGLLLGIGGLAGTYCGARCQRYVPARLLKGMLAVVLLGTAAQYLLQYLF